MKKHNMVENITKEFVKKNYKKPKLTEVGSVLKYTKNNGFSLNQDNGQSQQVRVS